GQNPRRERRVPMRVIGARRIPEDVRDGLAEPAPFLEVQQVRGTPEETASVVDQSRGREVGQLLRVEAYGESELPRGRRYAAAVGRDGGPPQIQRFEQAVQRTDWYCPHHRPLSAVWPHRFRDFRGFLPFPTRRP